MGSQQSRQPESEHVKHPRKHREPVNQADISAFAPRVRDIMSDPAYRSGVTSQSVIDMLNDIHDVYAGISKHVRLPQPIDGLAPANSIKFSTSSSPRLETLIQPDVRYDNTSVSRRTFSRRLSQNTNPHYNQKYEPALDTHREKKRDPITVNIDDAIAYTNNIPNTNEDDLVPVDGDMDNFSINDINMKPDPIVPRLSRRVKVRRPV